MSGHTPGPWTVKQFGGAQISGPNGYAVATMWGALSVAELKGQDRANAALIAAAPDLLAALIEAADFIQPFNRAEELLERIGAAIAKARALPSTPGEPK